MRKEIARQQREERILLSLKKLDYLSRSQLQTLHGLGSARNASRVLKNMEQYISSFRDSENIYYLNKEGRERVNCQKVFKKTMQARHVLMRNDLYIACGQPATWKNEMKLEVKGRVSVIADALFIRERRYHIVEVDHTQKMGKNRTKVERYRKLIDLGVFEKQPLFLWVTMTEYRRKQLLSLCEGLDVKVFTIRDFH
ncbi:replication-relaxation family protein [Bacillus sp. 7884-1]|uniref:replication-relaxation family protein n=1 Tax=Bacillus sp. 7884-1 TaxID=2021693 RepID=UPI0027B96AC8|nr:replication-relaxation family protein [Bacillus sp. 7884-1]